MRDFFDRFKYWVGGLLFVMASSTTLGMTVDRPAWKSELNTIEEQVAGNTNQVGCMNLNLLQNMVWAAEDRYNANKTQSNLERLREVRLRLRRAIEKGYVCG